MPEYRSGAHSVFDIHMHLVWITKYRRPTSKGEVAARTRDLIRNICGQHKMRILKGHAVAEKEDGTPSDGGVSAHKEAVLGAVLAM